MKNFWWTWHSWLTSQHLSDLNKVLQGKDILVHCLVSTLKSFIKKLKLWIQQLKDQNFAHFSQLGIQKCSRTEDYTTSLEYLLGDFNGRFEDVGDLEQPLKIFCSPFEVDIIVAPSDVQLELLDLQESEEHKGKFMSLSLLDFYKYLADFNFPGLCKYAKRMICMFGSTYRCEQCFSKLKFIKNKFRNSLTDEHMLDCLRTATYNVDGLIDNCVYNCKQPTITLIIILYYLIIIINIL